MQDPLVRHALPSHVVTSTARHVQDPLVRHTLPSHVVTTWRVQDPLAMIGSSYKMFVQWGWVRTDNLNADVAQQLASLRRCDGAPPGTPTHSPSAPH